MELLLPLELFRGSQAPCRAVCGTCGFFRMMYGGVSAPSCCAFPHRVAFKEVSGYRVLFKRGPRNRGLSAYGTTHVASLKFPRETGLILRCAGKVRNPFQTKLGNRPSRRYQEGIRGSEQAVHRILVFPSSETRVSENICGNIKVSNYHFKLQDGTWDFS